MNRTAQRTMEILKYIGENPQGVFLHNIAADMDIPKSSAYVILQTLLQMKYVTPHPENENRYLIGIECFTLGMKYISEMDLVREVTLQLAPLAEKYGKTGFLGTLDGKDVVYLQKYKSNAAMMASCEIGSRKGAHSTALGKAMVAFLPPKQLETFLQDIQYEKVTAYTIDNEETLLKQLAEIRRAGIAVDVKENNSLLMCCAAPIFDSSNQVVAAISLSDIFDENEDMLAMGDEIRRIAQDISYKLGNINKVPFPVYI